MNDSDRNLNDARDQLTDRVLAEALGGESPPDQATQITRRIAEERATPRGSVNTSLQSRRAWITLLATAASLMIGLVAWRDVEDRFGERSVALAGESSASQTEEESQAVSPNHLVEIDRLSGSPDYSIEGSAELPTEPMLSRESDAVGESVEGIEYQIGESVNSDAGVAGQISLGTTMEEQLNREKGQAVIGSSPLPGDLATGQPDSEVPSQTASTPSVPQTTDTTRLAKGLQVAGGRSDKLELWDRLGSEDKPIIYIGNSAPDSTDLDVVGVELPGAFNPELQHFGYQQRDRRGRWPEPTSGDRYAAIQENEFIQPEGAAALSTFSIDVDTASYTGVRQYLLDARRLPPADAVRIEELVNYFDYDYTAPASDSEDPFTAAMEVQPCPWKPEHRLVRIGIKGREIDADRRPLSNLVFLVDVSGSMNQPNKLPLVVEGLKALTERLGENDRVAIVVYAGSQGLVLPSTPGTEKDAIRSALGRLQAGGSTAGGAGLKLAYDVAERHKIPGGVNRVVLCTDGDFNVGLTGTEELAELVESRGKEQGIFLTVLGFGRGNLNDEMLETISGRGDGHYAYIDSEREARRVLSRDLSGTLVTIAKDVKLQVEFNPAKVAAYRLIGYENRVMAAKDFNDDTKDAGEIGAGHTVTALYEVVPVGVEEPVPPVDGLKYQESGVGGQGSGEESKAESREPRAESSELLTLKVRYKQPEGGASKKLEFPLEAVDFARGFDSRIVSDDFRWAAAVAEFGMLLRHSRHAGEASFDSVLEMARGAVGKDSQGYRAEFLDLVRRAKELSGR